MVWPPSPAAGLDMFLGNLISSAVSAPDRWANHGKLQVSNPKMKLVNLGKRQEKNGLCSFPAKNGPCHGGEFGSHGNQETSETGGVFKQRFCSSIRG